MTLKKMWIAIVLLVAVILLAGVVIALTAELGGSMTTSQ